MVSNTEISESSKPGSKGRSKNIRNRNYERQREKILTNAGRLFWKKGYLGTSTDDIARVTSLNKSTIFYYFKNKVSILYTLAIKSMGDLQKRAQDVIESDTPPEKKLEQLISSHILWQTSNIGLAGIGQLEIRNLSPKLRRELVDMRDQYELVYRNVIEKISIRDGYHLKSEDLKLLSLFVLGFLNSMVQWYNPSGPLSPKMIASRACGFVFRGLECLKKGMVLSNQI
jgi:AcrR family transcriptional regulator